ncbi:MAG: EamA family transporter RarD [Sphingopyxis sp.]
MTSTDAPKNGLPFAVGAYLIWGFVPLFFRLLSAVPPQEVLAQRIIWSVPLCLIILVVRRQLAEFRAALTDWRVLRLLACSAVLIAMNWLVYINAIFTNHVLAASLGYYLNPLVNVLLGVVFLKERLTRLQGVAVAIAAVGVAILLAGALDTLWISLSLALSFGTYGLIRKVVPVGSLPGLTIETMLLLPLSIVVAAHYLRAGDGVGFAADTGTTVLMMAGGVVTAVPLLLFATAARRMSYAALGFVQYLAPTIAFALSLFVFHEPLRPAQLACFLLIWASIGVFSYDMWRKMRAASAAANAAA